MVAQAFEQVGVRYLLGGSLASTAFGEPRSTLDVDFAADLTLATFDAWADAVEPSFFLDRAWSRREVVARGSFQLLHRSVLLRVDVFVPPWRDLHLWKWEHRTRLALDRAGTAMIDVTSPEGIVLQKLSWYRSGGEVSDRQWRDVVGVLKTQVGRLDRTELVRWARNIDVDELLQRAESDAGWPPRHGSD